MHLHLKGGLSETKTFLTGRDGALDLVKARAGGFLGGFFAVYIPSPIDKEFKIDEMTKAFYDLPLPDAIDWESALPTAMAIIAILFDLENKDALKVCRSVSDIQNTLAEDKISAILHLEGAEAIDKDLQTLEVLYQAGLRSLGPVWSRPNIFGHGVPFRYPSNPNIGPGLTEHGIRLIKRCNKLGIMVDVSHLNAAGFWDVANQSDRPLVATHSNVHAICPHSRNLTDDQLTAIKESDGMVGLNFAAAFLREDGRMIADVKLDQMLRHLDYLIEYLGEDRVGLGSDYDGAVVPTDVTTVADLPNLRKAMIDHGYDNALMVKLCHKNWLRVLDKTWTD